MIYPHTHKETHKLVESDRTGILGLEWFDSSVRRSVWFTQTNWLLVWFWKTQPEPIRTSFRPEPLRSIWFGFRGPGNFAHPFIHVSNWLIPVFRTIFYTNIGKWNNCWRKCIRMAQLTKSPIRDKYLNWCNWFRFGWLLQIVSNGMSRFNRLKWSHQGWK